MKLHILIYATLLTAASSLSTVHAADADKAPAEAAPKAQPPSPVQEKAGMAPKAKATDEKAEKAKDKSKDRTRHLHPRDGK